MTYNTHSFMDYIINDVYKIDYVTSYKKYIYCFSTCQNIQQYLKIECIQLHVAFNSYNNQILSTNACIDIIFSHGVQRVAFSPFLFV